MEHAPPISTRLSSFFSRLGAAVQVLGACVLLIAVLHGALGAYDAYRSRFTEAAIDDRGRHLTPLYAGFPAEDFWREHNRAFETRFQPYYHWRRTPFTGTYTNVDAQGVRLTPKTPAPGAKKVFVFGGSTVWGTGVPDGDTIPAQLQKLLGNDFDVYNLGESGWVTTQSLHYLMHRLAQGDVPHAVIFYDGVNDTYAGAYSPAVPRDPLNLRDRSEVKEAPGPVLLKVLAQTNLKRIPELLTARGPGNESEAWDAKVAPHIQPNLKASLDVYEANVRQTKALGAEYGFRTWFLWQPNLMSLTKKMHPYEEQLLKSKSPTWLEVQRQAYLLAKQRLSGREAEGIYFIGDLFNDVEDNLYIDQTHVGPVANRLVAEEMHRRLADALREGPALAQPSPESAVPPEAR